MHTFPVGFFAPSGGFIPANALGWWDASDTATITEVSGAVSQIDDKVGTEHLVQATASEKPTTGTRTHNGLNVLDCDGGDYIEKSSFPIPSDGNIVFYGVFGIDAVNDTADSIISCDASNDFQFGAENGSQFRAGLRVSNIGADINSFASNKNGPSLYKAVFDFSGAVQYSVFVDGAENPDGPNTYTNKLSTSQVLRVMANRNGAQRPDGFFAELIIVPAVDTAVEAYLKAKWNTP